MAEAAGRPCTLSAWQLAAAAHLSEEPRIVLLRDGERLVGVAPFCRDRWPGPLWIEGIMQVGWNFGHGIAPHVLPGHEDAMARAIAEHAPPPDRGVSMLTIEWDDRDSTWPERIAGAWDGRMRRRTQGSQVCPVVTTAESHDAWRAGRSRNFRETIKRKTKAIAKRGGTIRRAETPEEALAGIEGTVAVHRERFAAMGKHTDLTAAHREALLAAAPELVRSGGLRLWLVEHEGRVVAGPVHLWAGDAVLYYTGGMDHDWLREAPGLVLLHEAVRDAHELGARTLDLGPGDFDYKRRFADGEATVGSRDLFRLDRRYPLVRARLARKHLTQYARRRASQLPEERRRQLKRLLRRGG
jgi:hypothetical protein